MPPSPSGDPNATTCCPTRTESESPSAIGVRSLTPDARSTAMSELGSRPMMRTGQVRPSWKTAVTLPPAAAAATTWLLVSISPSALSTIPEPSPDCAGPVTRSCTTLGSTCRATASIGPSGAPDASAVGSGAPSAAGAPAVCRPTTPPTAPPTSAAATATTSTTPRPDLSFAMPSPFEVESRPQRRSPYSSGGRRPGRRSTRSAPPSGARPAQTAPPWRTATCRTMASPSPEPGMVREVSAR